MILKHKIDPLMGVYGLAWLHGRKLLFSLENGVKWFQNKSHVINRIIPRPNMSLYGTFEGFMEFTAYETPLMAVNSSIGCYKVFQGLKLA